MNNWQVALYASAVGAAGSLAYFSALYYGFIGNAEMLGRIWASDSRTHFAKKVFRVIWFALIGAAVAFIFQLPETNLAAILAFIVGTTWPTIVAQVLTSRQSETPDSIKDQINKLLGPKPQ